MSPVLVALGAVVLVGTTVVVLAAWVGSATPVSCRRSAVGSARPRRRAGTTRGGVFGARARRGSTTCSSLRSGVLRLWLAAGAAREVTVQALEPGEGRGLGGHPVVLRFTRHDRREVAVAVAHQDAGLLVGPFPTAAMSGLPEAPRERGT
jgi:hypothetical protein